MANMANAIVKTATVNIAALLAAYLLSKVADKSTKFVDTRTAITTVALQAAQEAIAAKLAQTTAGQ